MRVLDQAIEDCLQERRELAFVHLTGAHRKLAMVNATEAADMAVDRNIVRRIRKDEFRLGAFQQAVVGGLVASITAQQTMVPQHPEISVLGDRWAGWIFRHVVFRAVGGAGRLARLLKNDVDLRHLKPGQLDVDVELDQALQFDRQKLLVPPGVFERACCRPGCRRAYRPRLDATAGMWVRRRCRGAWRPPRGRGRRRSASYRRSRPDCRSRTSRCSSRSAEFASANAFGHCLDTPQLAHRPVFDLHGKHPSPGPSPAPHSAHG